MLLRLPRPRSRKTCVRSLRGEGGKGGLCIWARTFVTVQRSFGDDVPRHKPRSSEGKPLPRQRGTAPPDTTRLQHPCRQTSSPPVGTQWPMTYTVPPTRGVRTRPLKLPSRDSVQLEFQTLRWRNDWGHDLPKYTVGLVC